MKQPKTMIAALLGLFLGQNPGVLSTLGGVLSAAKLAPKQKTEADFARILQADSKRATRNDRNLRLAERGAYGPNYFVRLPKREVATTEAVAEATA